MLKTVDNYVHSVDKGHKFDQNQVLNILNNC